MGVRTSEVGFKVRVDTRELRDLTKSAKQLSDLISELRELRATASSVINGVGNAVDKINRDTATSVATLKAEVQQLRREVEAANRAGGSRAPGGAGGAGGGAGTRIQSNYDHAVTDRFEQKLVDLNGSIGRLTQVIVGLEDRIRINATRSGTGGNTAPPSPSAASSSEQGPVYAGSPPRPSAGKRSSYASAIYGGLYQDYTPTSVPPMPSIKDPSKGIGKVAANIPQFVQKATQEAMDWYEKLDAESVIANQKIAEAAAKRAQRVKQSMLKQGADQKTIDESVAKIYDDSDHQFEQAEARRRTNRVNQIAAQRKRYVVRDIYSMARDEGLVDPATFSSKAQRGDRLGGTPLLRKELIRQALGHALGFDITSSDLRSLTRVTPEVIRNLLGNQAGKAGKPAAPSLNLRDLIHQAQEMTPSDIAGGLTPDDLASLKGMRVPSRLRQQTLLRHAYIRKIMQGGIGGAGSGGGGQGGTELADLLYSEVSGSVMNTRAAGDRATPSPPSPRPRANPAPTYWDRTGNMFGLMSRVAIAGTAIYGGKELLMNSVKQMADFEDRLNRVRKVLQPTQADIKALGAAAIRMGQEFGTSISTIAGTMELVAQQGKKQADIISITRTATMAANVTNLDAAEAIDTITAAMKAFQMQGTQSMRVLDSWNELENTTGVSAKTLAEATKYAGAAARNAGVDFDQFNGIVATIAETTRQSGEQVGTVIRMMLEGYKDDRGIEALQNVGVLVADNTGKYKSFSSVLDQLTKVWPRLSEAQKQNVGVSLAGTRNLNAFFALMDNLPKLQENVAKSMNSGGSAARENEKAVESLNRKIESLKAAYDGLWQSIGNSGVLTALKVVTQTLKQMVDLIGTVNTGSGGLLGAAAAIGIPMLAVRGMGMAGGSGIMEERRVELLAGTPGIAAEKAATAAAAAVTSNKTTGLSDAIAPTRANQPTAIFPAFSDAAKVRMGAGVGLLTLANLKQQYDERYRPKSPSLTSTGVDIASSLGTTYLTAALATGKAAPWRGFGASGKFGKAMLALMAIQAAGSIYGSIRDYMSSSSAQTQQAASSPETNAKVGKLAQDANGMMLLVSKSITETITQYTHAVENLVRSNNQILDSQKLVASNLVLLGDITGKGSAVTGGGIQAMIAANAGYAKIRERDIGGGGGLSFRVNPNDLPGTFREAMGAAIAAKNGGGTLGLLGMANLGSQLRDLGGIAGGSAGNYVKKLIEAQGITFGRTPTEGEENVINAFETQLQRLVGDQEYGHVRRAIDESVTAQANKNPEEAARAEQRAIAMANAAIRDQSFQASEAISKSMEDLLSKYVGNQQSGVQSLAERYEYLRQAGQVTSPEQFLKRPEVTTAVQGLQANADDAQKTADATRAIFDTLKNLPEAERTEGYVKALDEAERAMKTAASTAKTLGSSMGTLNRDIHAFQAGAMQIDEALGAASVRIKGGGALGYTGLNALQFSFGQNAAERSALLAEFGGKTSPENLAKMLQLLEQISHNTRQQVGEIQAQRSQAISGAPQAYGMYRFMSQMGVMNPGAGGGGATQAGQAMLDQYHELLQDIYAKNAGRLNGASESERNDFARQVQDALGEFGGRMRDLELSSDPDYQRNYLLSSPSQRAMADYARGMMRSGMSAEDIFADPYSRQAAQGNPLLGRVLDQAVAGDYQRQTVDLLKDMVRLQSDAVAALTGRGLLPSHAAGTLNQAGSGGGAGGTGVDSSGRIAKDGQLARLHKGEIVLNKWQSEELLRNHYDTGTAPFISTPRPPLVSNSNNPVARGLYDRYATTAYGPRLFGRTVRSLSGLPAGEQAAMLARIMQTAGGQNLLGIGRSGTRDLMKTLETVIGPTGVGVGANFDRARLSGRLLSPSKITLNALEMGRFTSGSGQVSLFAAQYGHELQHGLNEMWRLPPGAAGKNQKFYRTLASVVLDNSDPMMRLARGRVFHRYAHLRDALTKGGSGGADFWSSRMGQIMLDEVLGARVQIAGDAPLPAVLRELNQNSLAARMKFAKLGGVANKGALAGVKDQAILGGAEILERHGYLPASDKALAAFLSSDDWKLATAGRARSAMGNLAGGIRGMGSRIAGMYGSAADFVGGIPGLVSTRAAAIRTGMLGNVNGVRWYNRFRRASEAIGGRVGPAYDAVASRLGGAREMFGGIMSDLGANSRSVGQVARVWGRTASEFGDALLDTRVGRLGGRIAGFAGDLGRASWNGTRGGVGKGLSAASSFGREVRGDVGEIAGGIHTDMSELGYWARRPFAVGADMVHDLFNPGWYDRDPMLISAFNKSRHRYGVNNWIHENIVKSPVGQFLGEEGGMVGGWLRSGGKAAGQLGRSAWDRGLSLGGSALRRTGGRLGSIFSGTRVRGAMNFASEALHPAMFAFLVGSQLYGWDQKAADKIGMGGFYRESGHDILNSAMGLQAARITAQTGSVTGLGLRARGLETLATAVENYGLRAGRLAGAFEGTSTAIRFGSRGLGMATRVAGRIAEPIMAAELGYHAALPLGYVTNALWGTTSNKVMAQAHAQLGEGTSAFIGDSFNAIVGGHEGRSAFKQVGSQYISNLTKGDMFARGYDGRSWYNPAGLYYTVGQGVSRLFGWNDAREQLRDEFEESLNLRAGQISNILHAKVLAGADPELRKRLESRLQKLAGPGDENGTQYDSKESYVESLKKQYASVSEMLKAYGQYAGMTDDQGTAGRKSQIVAYADALQKRIANFSALTDPDQALEIYTEGFKNLYPEGYRELMGSGVRNLIGDKLAQGFGIPFDGETAERLTDVATMLGGNTTVQQLIERLTGSVLGNATSDLSASGYASKGDLSGAWKERLAAALNKTTAGELATSLARGNTGPNYFSKQGASAIHDVLAQAAGDVNQWVEFNQLREGLKPRVDTYGRNVATVTSDVQALMKELAIPAYTRGASTGAIATLIEKYNDRAPAARKSYKGVAGEFAGITSDSAKLVSLFNGLPESLKQNIYTQLGVEKGNLTAAQIGGFTPPTSAGLGALSGYFEPEGGGTLDRWLPNALATSRGWDAANAAWADAGPSVDALASRDQKMELIRRQISYTRNGRTFFTTGVRRADGPEGTYYGGGKMSDLMAQADAANAGVVAREQAGQQILNKVAFGQMSGTYGSGAAGYLAGLEAESPGLSAAVQQYGQIKSSLDSLKGSTDINAEAQRATLEKQKADLILGRQFTEGFYAEALNRAQTLTDLAKKQATKVNAATEKAAEKIKYSVDGKEINYETSEGRMVFRRHMGGAFTGEAIIKTGQNRSEMVISPERTDQFYAGLDAIKKVATRDDPMSSDARQFVSTVTPSQATGGGSTLEHSGEVKLGMDSNMMSMLSQVIAALQQTANNGTPMRVGDKVFNPLVGR